LLEYLAHRLQRMSRMFVVGFLNKSFQSIRIEVGWEIRRIWRFTIFLYQLGLAVDLEIILIEWQLGNLPAIYKRTTISYDDW